MKSVMYIYKKMYVKCICKWKKYQIAKNTALQLPPSFYHVMSCELINLWNHILLSVSKTLPQHTSSAFGSLNERCLEYSSGPGAGYKAVRVPDHREHHGRCGINSIFNLLPYILHVSDIKIWDMNIQRKC